MKKLTIALPEDVYDRAQRRATEQGGSLPAQIVELVKRFGDTADGSHASANGSSDIEKRFQELARQWRDATAFTSSTTDMVVHPAYQQIIGMGRDALPSIFADLRRTPDHWFWALRAITGEDPVPPADRGKIQRMAEAWLAWAAARGY